MRLYFFLASLFIVHISNAQTNDYSGFKLGAVLYGNSGIEDLSTSLRSFRGAEFSNYSGISGGLIARYQFVNFFLQTEVTFDNRSTEDLNFVSLDAGSFETELRASFSYVNVPLIVGYSFSSNKLNPYVSTGVQVGISTKNEVVQTFGPGIPDFIPQNQPITVFDKTEIGILGEIGVNYSLSPASQIQFGIRYTTSQRSFFLGSDGSANLNSRRVSAGMAYLYGF